MKRPSSLDDTALVKAAPTAFCNNNKQNDDKTTAYINEFAVEQVEDADLVQRVECRTQNNDLSVTVSCKKSPHTNTPDCGRVAERDTSDFANSVVALVPEHGSAIANACQQNKTRIELIWIV